MSPTDPTEARLMYGVLAVAPRLANEIGPSMKPALCGPALRLLLAIDAAADEQGRYRTAYGAGTVAESKRYYSYLNSLQAGRYIERERKQRTSARHLTITTTGRAATAKARRRIEDAAREYLSGARY